MPRRWRRNSAMLLRIGADGAAVLEEAGEFTRFAVALHPAAPAGALAAVARRDGAHAWIAPETLRRLSPMGADAAWQTGFAAMLDFARSRGWVDAEGAIRAHVEPG